MRFTHTVYFHIIVILLYSGTGKTSTIIGLVSSLLNGSCPRQGSKASGIRIHVRDFHELQL